MVAGSMGVECGIRRKRSVNQSIIRTHANPPPRFTKQAEFEAAYARAHRHRKAALAFVQDLLRNLHPTARAAVGTFFVYVYVYCMDGFWR